MHTHTHTNSHKLTHTDTHKLICFLPSLSFPRPPVREEDGELRVTVSRAVAQLVSSTVEWVVNPELTDLAAYTGVLMFPAGVASQDIVLPLVDDDDIEYPKDFTITLVDPSPGRLGDRAALSVLLRASEQPWGNFAMKEESVPAMEGGPGSSTAVRVPVVRQRGTDGTVVVSWALQRCVRCLAPTANVTVGLASGECQPCTQEELAGISPTSGALTFLPDETQHDIRVNITGDALPELTQWFFIDLTGASVDDLSGINAEQQTCAIVVEESDAPLGEFVVEFAHTMSSSSSTAESPATADVAITHVSEDEGARVEVLVVREAGDFGDVLVDWQVYAVSSLFVASGNSSDVAVSHGQVAFVPTQRQQSFFIDITNDDIPELAETFRVALSSPTRGAVISETRGHGLVTIDENDFPYGVVSVAPSSQVVVVSEADGQATVTLARTRGVFGNITVAWELAQAQEFEQDVDPLQGTVSFAEGADAGAIVLTVSADSMPETAESILIQLTGVVAGDAVLASDPSQLQALVVIRASDEPHGVFVFGGLSYSFPEPASDQGDVEVTVPVQRLHGTIGTVAVVARTFVLSSGVSFASTLDFAAFSNETLVFAPNDTEHELSVLIRADDIPELAERFALQLVSAALLSGDAGPYASTSPRLGSVQQTTITIEENDDARGVFTIDGAGDGSGNGSVLAMLEEGDAFPLTVRRDRGLFGQVTVQLTLTSRACTQASCAVLGMDVVPDVEGSSSGVSAAVNGDGVLVVQMVFQEGDSSKSLRLNIADDQIPEILEQVQVDLLSTSPGRVGSNARSAILQIAENDDARGVFAFANTTAVVVEEPEADSGSGSGDDDTTVAPLRIAWVVERRFGTFHDVAVDFQLRGGPEGFEASFNATAGTLFFPQFADSAELVLYVLPDSVPELTQNVVVELVSSSAQNGARIASAPANARELVVLPSDDAFGVFSLPIAQWVPTEGGGDGGSDSDSDSGVVVPMVVTRTGGLFGDVRLTLSVDETTADLLARAQLSFPFNFVPRIVIDELFASAVPGANFDVLDTLSGVASVVQCKQRCLDTPGCASASYGSGNGECLLSGSTTDSPLL